MNTLELNRNSWHYRLATKYSNYREVDRWGYPNVDFCEYTKKVFGGLMICFLIVVGCSLVGSMVLDFAMWIWFWLHEGFLDEPGGFAMGFIFTVFYSLILLIFFRFVKTAPKVISKVEKSFLGLAYESFKDRVCFTIKFK